MSYIPEKVTYVFSYPKVIQTLWESKGLKPLHELKVIPAFPLDTNNAKKLETAEAWAKRYKNGRWQDGQWIELPGDRKQNITRDNEPFLLRLVGLETRAEGGRAWKVVDFENNYMFDLREDILLETLINGGAEVSLLKGTFVWAVIGSQTKLVRVDSDLYKLLVKETAARLPSGRTKKIKKKDLVVGGVYASDLGTVRAVYCGEVENIVNHNKYQLWFNLQDTEKAPQEELKSHKNKCLFVLHENRKFIHTLDPIEIDTNMCIDAFNEKLDNYKQYYIKDIEKIKAEPDTRSRFSWQRSKEERIQDHLKTIKNFEKRKIQKVSDKK